MGGSSGPSFSQNELRLQQAAEERLRVLASQSSKVLFVCEIADRKSLDFHLARSTTFTGNCVSIVDSSGGGGDPLAALAAASFLCPFHK